MNSCRYSNETQMTYFETILIVKFNRYLKLFSEIPPIKTTVIDCHTHKMNEHDKVIMCFHNKCTDNSYKN